MSNVVAEIHFKAQFTFGKSLRKFSCNVTACYRCREFYPVPSKLFFPATDLVSQPSQLFSHVQNNVLFIAILLLTWTQLSVQSGYKANGSKLSGGYRRPGLQQVLPVGLITG